MGQLPFIYYLPILTTVISLLFSSRIFRRYRERGGGNHLLWWGSGVLIYGLATLSEAWITLWGWNALVFKFWYIAGALMGGAPLAQGTVWFLLRPVTARRLTILLVTAIGIASFCVMLTPIDLSVVNFHLPSGRAFAWQWVRAFSPFINIYAVVFLIGGALLSAWRFRKYARADNTTANIDRDRFIGNVYIALGAMLPAIGGVASRAGHTEVHYIMELLGIAVIWVGYWYNIRKLPVHTAVRKVDSYSNPSF